MEETRGFLRGVIGEAILVLRDVAPTLPLVECIQMSGEEELL